MKKLSKNLNLKKQSLESYNAFSCSCDCGTYCDSDGFGPRYNVFKSLQGDMYY